MKNHPDHYWNKKWQITANEFKPNPFALKALDHIKTNIKDKTIDLLDLGCGDGKDSLFFAGYGMKVTAIDISDTALQNIKNNNAAILTEKQNFENLMLFHNSFDIIYAHLSLHYFDDEKTIEIINKINHALKPNGLFFIKVKSIHDWQYGQGKQVALDIFEDGHLRHFFRIEKLKAMLQGFSIHSILETADNYNGHNHGFIEAVVSKY